MKNFPLHDGTKMTVTGVKYHRNGIAGPGFYAVAFTHEDRSFTGVADADSGLVYVTENGDIEATMRGHDFFGDAIIRAINIDSRRRARESGWSADKPLVKGRI